MEALLLPQTLSGSLDIYGYGLTTGLLFATCVYMLLLANFYRSKKNIHAYKLFLYNAICNFLFIFFDIFAISLHSAHLAITFPSWMITLGQFIMPIALLLSFNMFVKAIPIKTVEAFFFWDDTKRFYPIINGFFIASFIALLLINDSKFSFTVSLMLIILMSLIEYIISIRTLNFARYKRLQQLILIILITLIFFVASIYTTKGFAVELQPMWFIIRLVIGTLIVLFSFIISRFIVQEHVYFQSNPKINGEDFFKEIYNASKHHNFYIEYQPKVYIDSQKISGAEALIRWQHPKHGFIPPNDFIPLAEKTDLINQICKWVIVRVVRDVKDMSCIGINVPISINFSVKNLHAKMVNFLIDTLQKYEVSNDMVIVEITETMFLDMNESHKQALAMLREANIRLSMDDFGAGHSSFAYFDEIGLNELKLDRKIANNILMPNKDKVVSTVINLCHSLDIKVVAEGIEDNEIQQKLLAINCDYAQGFGICRPKRLEDFIDWIRVEQNGEDLEKAKNDVHSE